MNAREGQTPPAQLVSLATDLGLRVAVAESLTGGLLAAALVGVPGASRVFSGGVVAYDTFLKHTLLGVDRKLLAARGPVDAGVARQMALGVRRACATPPSASDPGTDLVVDAEIGLSTTGVAGPDPDPATGQAVGTVWIGVSSILGERAVPLLATGDRRQIRDQTVARALQELGAELLALASKDTRSSGT